MTIPKSLFHYYELDNGPFRNITEYGFEKAEIIQKQIIEGWNSKRPENYVGLRFSLEKRIREQFILKGGKPNRNDPFYFTLGECDWAKSWYINPGVIKIPLTDFNPDHISFTYPDSMVSFQFYDEPKLKTYRKNCNGQIFLLSEISDLINEYGIPSEEKCQIEERLKYDKYIEAQVWDDEVIKEYKNKA
ncbi:hypothetical protein FAZ19_18905 [Sphingobacterium alkalisoli]|uniref:Uncharacterized protein n=1 Tax=Sphingobacterium alkalisoli TaxID=1874115 RepID=A0A4U0GUI9_9SPHI|nr:hypothetical protein [Sphingobacterium alkalisoli]TJY62546.1 hypothetical protein FAZ19_18905 [Sphingobacterium alkalisoli]GGH27351.1 hypothetical protein GCM10011418_37240 [Sphingobacterium alkalisoli]